MKDNELYRAAQNTVCDNFHRLGGSGQYRGFQHWHCYALIAIVCKRISQAELDGAGIYINHNLWDRCDGIYKRVEEQIKGSNSELGLFLSAISQLMERNARRYGNYEDYRGWITFNWYLKHRELGYIWNQ